MKTFTHLYYVFFINLNTKRTIVALPFSILFFFLLEKNFFLYFFLFFSYYSKFFYICFLQFFFVKRSKNFFTIEITNDICPQHNIFNFCNVKHFFWPTWNTAFCKNVFLFRYSYMITNFKFRTFLTTFFIKVNIYAYISAVFILMVLWYVLLSLITMSSNLSIDTFFNIEDMYL